MAKSTELPTPKTNRYTRPGNGASGGEEHVDPSDHDRNDPQNGAPGGGPDPTHATRRLEEHDRWLRSFLQNSPEVYKVVDPDGTLRYASPAFEKVLGYDPEKAAGTMNVLDHVHPDDLSRVLEETERALAEGRAVSNSVEYRFRHRDGSWRWVESVGTYLLDDPAVRGVVVSVRDITRRKEAEQELHVQAQLLGAVGEAVIALDTDRRVVYWNRAAEEVYGWSAEETMGRRLMDRVVPEDLRTHAEEIMAGVRAGLSWKGEFVVRRRDGTRLTVEATNTPVLSEDGGQVGVVGVLKDVTEHRKAEEALRRSEAELFSVLESITDGFFALDREWRFAYVNPQAALMLGRVREGLVGERIWEDDTFYPEYRRAVEEGRTVKFEGCYLPRKRWYDVRAYPSESGLSVYFQDITERKVVEEALRESEERFRGTFEDAPNGVALVGLPSSSPEADKRYLRVNRALCEMLGYSEELLLSKTSSEVTHPDDLEECEARTQQIMRDGGSKYAIEKRYVRSDGRVVWVMLNVSLIRDSEGNPSHFVSQFQDVTDRKALEERLRHQALHDTLTDLPNRRLFVDRLEQALERTGRRDRLVAVLFMDLDNFKGVNDSLGHDVGDLLLVAVAERLERYLGPEDTLARFGGDEFAVLMGDMEAADEAARVAERIAEGFGSPFLVGDRELYARASIGIATGGACTKSPEDLLRDADTAMYRAKDEGSGHYSMFDPAMYERAVGRLEMENGLRQAIEHEQFVVHYQPIVSLDDGTVWGVEALLRWEHPEHGLLDPGEFVPVAEESGLVGAVGERVLMEACRKARGWQEEHPRTPPLVMSVNLSAKQIGRHDLAKVVEGVLQETGLEARCLSLDVTETVYVRALEGNMAPLERLKEIGVGISIDDFGTGYSSLSYLKRLPADALKIDKSFVQGLGEGTENAAIVRMTLELARTLGMETIAEGVETEGQETLLRGMGCDMAQGYHFSRPLPPAAVSELLAN